MSSTATGIVSDVVLKDVIDEKQIKIDLEILSDYFGSNFNYFPSDPKGGDCLTFYADTELTCYNDDALFNYSVDGEDNVLSFLYTYGTGVVEIQCVSNIKYEHVSAVRIIVDIENKQSEYYDVFNPQGSISVNSPILKDKIKKDALVSDIETDNETEDVVDIETDNENEDEV